ncbi:PRC-barrel domain-containing protein [Beijerinckia sp. L45]|uniref:PRC-barrel domain-containing protein n=1 Tax=Beijerinckia sp. L45 TaxID=1641855 RepID=UPI001FF01C10|nr:PRC-barrel domain-containing protein [Beijerinckia sp. L45]
MVDLSTMDALIGKTVRSSTGEDLGRLIDLVVETNGQVRAAIIDFGGVLGVGSRKIAVDWRALDFGGSAKGGPIKLALTRNQVRLSPEYRSGEPIVILEDSGPEAPAPKAAAAAPATPTVK